jgi:hypothetical protein
MPNISPNLRFTSTPSVIMTNTKHSKLLINIYNSELHATLYYSNSDCACVYEVSSNCLERIKSYGPEKQVPYFTIDLELWPLTLVWGWWKRLVTSRLVMVHVCMKSHQIISSGSKVMARRSKQFTNRRRDGCTNDSYVTLSCVIFSMWQSHKRNTKTSQNSAFPL